MENSTSSFENIDNREMPKNNMALSVVGTILGLCSPCCIGLILGIIAIVMSSSVKKKFEAGDVSAAEKAAKNAKIMAIIALVLGVIGLLLNIFMKDLIMESYAPLFEKLGVDPNAY